MRADFKVDRHMSGIDYDYLKSLFLTGRKSYFRQGFKGETSTVAVIDSGVNPEHPELKGRVVDTLNYVEYGDGTDDHGHGTHCAGSIAGKNVGVAPETKILSVKVLRGDGSGNFDEICRALEELTDWRTKEGRRLTAVSMSLSTDGVRETPQQLDRLEKAVKELTEHTALVCSAGNTGRYQNRYPASIWESITVGAVNVDDFKPAGFTTHNKEVDLAQVGVDVLSAWYRGGYALMSGTSMATPKVAGISSLLADKFYQVFGDDIPEMVLYWMLKMNSKFTCGNDGLNPVTGAGFCSLQPVVADLYTRVGDKHMTLNDGRVDLRAPVTVVPPGVTSLPARELFEDVIGGLVEFNEQTKFARFRC